MMPLCTEDVYTAHYIPSTRHITCEHYVKPLFKSYLCKEKKNEREREHERERTRESEKKCAPQRVCERDCRARLVYWCIYTQFITRNIGSILAQ
jgi:hypothetical protein